MKTRLSHILLLGAIVISAAALLLVGSWYSYTSTFDTGTVGLMSVNIVQGDRPLFYYGQPYFGALEAYLAAVFISLFGFSEFTVTLSPIFFTLSWIIFTYLLFTRIHNSTAGIVAAACAAFPGYYVFWYSIATYGGYPIILCIGTALLWLSLRVLQERERKTSLLLHAVCIGTLMGLGIWVHALIFPYIIICACILGLFVLRERFRLDVILPLILAAVIALMGFLPFYFETGSFLGGVSEPVQLTRAVIGKALYNLFVVNSQELIVWNFTHTFASQFARYLALYTGLIVLFFALPLAFYSFLVSNNKELKRINYAVPLLFCLLFLALYVQHHLATVKAPRYAISFLCMLFCMLWSLAIAGQENRSLKRFSIALFCVWIGYQIAGTVLFITGSHSYARQEQNVAREVVQAARERNLKSVVTYGDHVLGLKAQKFSMFAENKIVFVSADTERYQQNAQFSETDLGRGYLVSDGYKASLENILKDLGVEFIVEKIDGYYLFSGLRSKQPRFDMRVVPSEDTHLVSTLTPEVKKAGQLLMDRNQDNAPELNKITGEELFFDTGKLRNLCGVWMFTFQDPVATEWKRPGPYEVYVSQDGNSYNKVFSSLSSKGNGFYAGSSLYLGGPWGKVEGLFAPIHGRYVKIIFLENTGFPVTELLFFETDGSKREESTQDVDQIRKFIEEEEIDFLLADRWMSAQLRESYKGSAREKIALPRFSTRYNNRPLDYYVRPENGRAILCETAVANECEKILIREYGDSVISKRVDLNNYSVFGLATPEKNIKSHESSALIWNGHIPLQTGDEALLPRWFNSLGLPIWRADFTKTKGIYRDSWTNGKGVFKNLDYAVDHDNDKELHVHTQGWRPGGEMADLKLQVFANKKIPLEFKEKDKNKYIFNLPGALNKIDSLELRSTTFVPPGPDARNLGLDIQYIEIK